MSVKLIRSYSNLLDGTLEIVTQRDNEEPKRMIFVFQQSHILHFRYSVEALTINFDTHLIQRMGFHIVGRPVDDVIEVWADGTDMPEEMAKAFLSHLYPNNVFVFSDTDTNDDGVVTSYNYEVIG